MNTAPARRAKRPETHGANGQGLTHAKPPRIVLDALKVNPTL